MANGWQLFAALARTRLTVAERDVVNKNEGVGNFGDGWREEEAWLAHHRRRHLNLESRFVVQRRRFDPFDRAQPRLDHAFVVTELVVFPLPQAGPEAIRRHISHARP
jgi:hypothetical protein